MNWRRILFGVGADQLSTADQELIEWAHNLLTPTEDTAHGTGN